MRPKAASGHTHRHERAVRAKNGLQILPLPMTSGAHFADGIDFGMAATADGTAGSPAACGPREVCGAQARLGAAIANQKSGYRHRAGPLESPPLEAVCSTIRHAARTAGGRPLHSSVHIPQVQLAEAILVALVVGFVVENHSPLLQLRARFSRDALVVTRFVVESRSPLLQ